MPTQTKQPAHGRKNFPLDRAAELSEILDAVKTLIIPFIRSADKDAATLPTGYGLEIAGASDRTVLVERHNPQELTSILSLSLPSTGLGLNDLSSTVASVLQYSVNTSSPGFLDKLYSSPSPPGIAADLLLSTLNANGHVYGVSPCLTHVEKHVGKELASLFGLPTPLAGGIVVPGGAAANLTALLVARNVRFPAIKEDGIGGLSRPLAIFISEAAHYSAMNAAQILGMGTKSVRQVATDVNGAMIPAALEMEIESAIEEEHIPFFIAATAGTTVRGAYDPLSIIGKISHKYNAWFHVDACWGGAAIFSEKLKHKLLGSELADSIAFNPQKMLGIPLMCSFLLGRDLRTFWYANRLMAGYLFHETKENYELTANGSTNGISEHTDADWRHSSALLRAPHPDNILDLASLTAQCGRRPDALKLYLHWRYYGKEGLARHVETAFEGAKFLASLIVQEQNLRLIGSKDVPCAQVCFYYSSNNVITVGKDEVKRNSLVTRAILARLLIRGWMVDYAPGTGAEDQRGDFIRVACNRLTSRAIAEGLLFAILDVGQEVVDELILEQTM